MMDKRSVVANIGAPRVRLTLAYAGLLVLLLATFSVIVYVLLSMVVLQDIEPFRDDPGIVAAAHRMLEIYVVRLLIANAVGLVFVVAVSAFLAKITLRPLERAIALQRQFTNDASHDLRTPLAVIRTEASVGLADDSLASGQREQLRIIDEQAQRMQRLIDQLITMSHLDADSALDREPTDLRAVVNGVLRDLQPLAQARAIDLKVGRCESAVVMGDELKLSQLVGNLVDNAIKYGGEQSTVDVSVWQSRDTAYIAVSDRGKGIPSGDLDRIFERYQRLHASGTNGTSEVHGLGLPLCRWIARAHGGELVARSTMGEGSVFTVRLPAMSA
jgi:two-component system, OmpR family, sensor histidine kinase CiaH